jgi:hypothetical protein
MTATKVAEAHGSRPPDNGNVTREEAGRIAQVHYPTDGHRKSLPGPNLTSNPRTELEDGPIPGLVRGMRNRTLTRTGRS